MRSAKQLPSILICALSCLLPVAAQNPHPAARISDKVTISIQQRQARFTSHIPVEQMRLQVFNQPGETVFDSGQVTVSEISWLLMANDGQPLKSGLYAYALSIREFGADAARVRRGYFIIDSAADRDDRTDRLWVTSQHAGAGLELTMASDENVTVAGVASTSDRTIERQNGGLRRDDGREIADGTQSKTEDGKTATAAAGTVGRIAKFITATEVGDSIITEQSDRIGIGTANPVAGYKLEVNGATLLTPGGSGGTIQFGTPSTETGMAIAGSNRADIRFDGSTLKLVAGPGVGPPSSTNGVAITTSGDVGIGTMSPGTGYKFDVNGATRLTPGGSGGAIQFGTPNFETGITIAGSNRADIRFDASSLKLVAGPAGGPPSSESGIAISTSGRVGIGTTNPVTKLHVEGVGIVEATIRSGNERAILALSNTLGPSSYVWTLESGVRGLPGLFGIYNRVVNRSGLEIDGNLTVAVRALRIDGGADLSENFDVRVRPDAANASALTVQPGMVVSIDPENPGKLTLSGRAYDRRVAGVVSGAGGVQPGMTMGQEGTLADGKHPVALSGRVYVWVDATRGAVKPGDLLTTSATPGHAMKVANSAKAQGAIIGKAMTGLKRGKGLVLTLVTLQ